MSSAVGQFMAAARVVIVANNANGETPDPRMQRTLQPAATHEASFQDVHRLHIPVNRNLCAVSHVHLAEAMDCGQWRVEVNINVSTP
jgi:hypothetical protein